MTSKVFKIGTRRSPLALKQAEMLKSALQVVHADLNIEIIPIKSAADWKMQDPEKALDTKNGGKGQFAKEIEDQILDGRLDCGVHSLKDMASFLPNGLKVAHYLPRVDARDAFICDDHGSLIDLPQGAVVGTCSPRRRAFILGLRPDLKVIPFRGNVKTRLDKVKAGQVDATYLAMAGITRLGINDPIIHAVDIEEMLPACGQGIVCMEIRETDEWAHKILEAINDNTARLCAVAEREILRVLDGSCHTPIAAYATIEGDMMRLIGYVASLDGETTFKEEVVAACSTVQEARELGLKMGEGLKVQLPKGFLE